MNNVNEWNEEYAKYHKNKTNKIIHWICIPLIMFSLLGLLSLMTLFTYNSVAISALWFFIIFAIGYYIKLSKSLALGMTIISICFIYFIELINQNFINQKFEIFLGIFIISWIGQFIGHKIEGKKPAFVKDLQFLLIGPLWLLSYIYEKLDIKL
tara:strand:- start:1104 stop:1565 length:462 start_codon:yes stop_codon:yes gene_type:complete